MPVSAVWISPTAPASVPLFSSQAATSIAPTVSTKTNRTSLTAARLVLDNVAKPYCAGLSILGGDPLWQSVEGMEQLHKLADEVHLLDKTVWLWSGFTWEALADSVTCFPDTLQDTALAVARLHLVCACDVVVDGPFQKDLKDLSLAWRGSSNQRVIDVQKTIVNSGNVVLWEGTT